MNELAKMLMDLFGMTGSSLYKTAREGDVYKSFADISRARMAFGFEPAVSLEDGLRETKEWYTGG